MLTRSFGGVGILLDRKIEWLGIKMFKPSKLRKVFLNASTTSRCSQKNDCALITSRHEGLLLSCRSSHRGLHVLQNCWGEKSGLFSFALISRAMITQENSLPPVFPNSIAWRPPLFETKERLTCLWAEATLGVSLKHLLLPAVNFVTGWLMARITEDGGCCRFENSRKGVKCVINVDKRSDVKLARQQLFRLCSHKQSRTGYMAPNTSIKSFLWCKREGDSWQIEGKCDMLIRFPEIFIFCFRLQPFIKKLLSRIPTATN